MAAPVETKVKLASFGAYFGSLAALGVANAVNADASLIAALPDWLEVLILPLVPTAVTFLSGYNAKHDPRPSDAPAL